MPSIRRRRYAGLNVAAVSLQVAEPLIEATHGTKIIQAMLLKKSDDIATRSQRESACCKEFGERKAMTGELRNVQDELDALLDLIAAKDVIAKVVLDPGRKIHIHQIYDLRTQFDTTQDRIEMLEQAVA
ncbi:hypothetical protein COCVIDRAFT_31249 [Bipolaris victoriae FI3]|uniref:Uncharacterized protein n=1 Tax=Bipolaris victoriae (strain FI3) TaxID=930091 RepID=W7E384_BIPV3|nr:hypothetical protein COCVIDRAFT_31249 [Bipolaris victoriae FI3]